MRERPYTIQELAERWSCTAEAIYALIRHPDNPLPAFKVGGKLWRVRAEIVAQWESDGGNTKSESTGSELSEISSEARTRRSSAGATTVASIAGDSASSLKSKVDRRLMDSLAVSKP